MLYVLHILHLCISPYPSVLYHPPYAGWLYFGLELQHCRQHHSLYVGASRLYCGSMENSINVNSACYVYIKPRVCIFMLEQIVDCLCVYKSPVFGIGSASQFGSGDI